MNIQLAKDALTGNYTKPNIFLCEADKSKICKLETSDTKFSAKFNSYSEISFEVGRVYNDLITGETKIFPYYDKIEALRLIYIENVGYFEIQTPSISGDGIKESKSVTAYSLEYTLSQKYLEDLYNDGTIGSVESDYIDSLPDGELPENATYPVVTLYNKLEPKLSLLHLVLEKAYGWEIGHVDDSIATKSRQFNIDRESIYDFIMNEICDMFNCYAVFDTINNTVNLYAESLVTKFICDGNTTEFIISPPYQNIGTVSDDGYKTTNYTYDEITGKLVLERAPDAGHTLEIISKDMTLWETDVFVSFDNLSQEVSVDYNADDIKTVLSVKYGEDQNIREVNLGLPYITDLSYYHTPDWMGQELYDAYTEYNTYCETLKSIYSTNVQNRLELASKLDYEENRVSTEYALIHNVNHTTVGTYYVRTGDSPNYYFIKKELPDEYVAGTTYFSGPASDTDVGRVNLTESNILNLRNALIDYFRNKSMEELDKLIEEFQFTNKNSLPFGDKSAGSYTDGTLLFYLNKYKTLAVYDETTKDRDDKLKQFINEILDEFGLNMLNNLREVYLRAQSGFLEGLTKANNANKDNPDDGDVEEVDPTDKDYPSYYPIVLILEAIEEEIGKSIYVEYSSPPATVSTGRFADYYNQAGEKQYGIDSLKTKIDELIQRNAEITKSITMETYFKNKYPDRYKVLMAKISPFLREDELVLNDIVSTELDTIIESLNIQEDAVSAGYIELQKLSQPQLSFTMNMANIYALPEFKPIIDQFQLGNLIKVAIRPGYIKQSRLLQVDMGLDNLSDFSCQFGELTSLRTQSDIHADLLSKAASAGKQVATYSSYWTKGSDKATATDIKIQNGLLDAVDAIKSTDGLQDVSIDKYGIHLRKSNPDNPSGYDDKQGWIVNNQFLYSDDAFKTAKSVFGEYTVDGKTYWGLLAEALIAGYIEGSDIVGGNIRIGDQNDGTYAFQVEDNGNFNFGGSNGIVYNSADKKITFGSDVTLNWNQINGTDNVATKSDIPSYITSTKITETTIESPSITGGNIYIGQQTDGTYAFQVENNGNFNFGGSNGIVYNSDDNTVTFGSNVVLKWNQIDDAPDGLTIEEVKELDVSDFKDANERLWSTEIGNTWISTANVYAANLTAGSIYADNILTRTAGSTINVQSSLTLSGEHSNMVLSSTGLNISVTDSFTGSTADPGEAAESSSATSSAPTISLTTNGLTITSGVNAIKGTFNICTDNPKDWIRLGAKTAAKSETDPETGEVVKSTLSNVILRPERQGTYKTDYVVVCSPNSNQMYKSNWTIKELLNQAISSADADVAWKAFKSSIIPANTNKISLGSSSKQWNALYVKTLYINGEEFTGGSGGVAVFG